MLLPCFCGNTDPDDFIIRINKITCLCCHTTRVSSTTRSTDEMIAVWNTRGKAPIDDEPTSHELKRIIAIMSHPDNAMLQRGADAVAASSVTWEGFSVSDAQCCVSAVMGTIPDPHDLFIYQQKMRKHMAKISLIVAFDQNRGIGHENKIPWFIPGELKWVGETTRATTDPEKINALIMGHNTWLSLPVDKRPLPGRLSVVISRNAEIDSPMVKVCRSFDEAIAYVKNNNRIETAFVFGGTRVYRQAVDADVLDEALLTIVPGQYDADTYFPEMPESMHCTERHTVKYGNTEVLRETWKKADA